MQQDHLEKFITHNRAEFDTETPDFAVWAKINQTLHPAPVVATSPKNNIHLLSITRRVAAAVALLITGAGLATFFQHGDQASLTDKETPQIAQAEQFYAKQVNQKVQQLASFHPDPTVMEDLQQMDEVQAELRLELESAPQSSREEIVERLIDVYKSKLAILELVLDKIKENDSQTIKDQKNDSI